MNAISYFKEQFEQLNAIHANDQLAMIRRQAFDTFNKTGIPDSRHEEWKYTRISTLFNKDYQFPASGSGATLTPANIDAVRLPGFEQANELIFVNGQFLPELSRFHSEGLVVMSLEEAAGSDYKEVVTRHLGHSGNYAKDGINALNMAFMQGGVFVSVEKGRVLEHPLYIYNITDARAGNIFSQPRSLVHINKQAEMQLVETFVTLGAEESFANHVIEIIVEQDATLAYYKIQNDGAHTSQVSTTHIRQVGKSTTHSVTISLDGALVRNNMNIVLEAEHCEAYLYGLYFQRGQTHIDNHTVVDNVSPHCYSNELYKGIMDDNATGVFNGKIFVRPQAQKTNAYQSNKNILLSDSASVNTKPQLEIFADDVKCSHGCTVGQLDDEGLFYLQSRGIPEKMAKSLLLHAFAIDILEKIKPTAIRSWVDQLISERLEFDVK